MCGQAVCVGRCRQLVLDLQGLRGLAVWVLRGLLVWGTQVLCVLLRGLLVRRMQGLCVLLVWGVQGQCVLLRGLLVQRMQGLCVLLRCCWHGVLCGTELSRLRALSLLCGLMCRRGRQESGLWRGALWSVQQSRLCTLLWGV